MDSSCKIGLALSGGGFRATLFHLGVVRFLYDTRLLGQVSHIASVSGGSVLAAHLGINWHRYTGSPSEFEKAAQELLAFTRSDVRGRILRRWLLAWLAILPRLMRPGYWTLTGMLKRRYAKLFRNATFGSLPPHLDLHILSTSMTTGNHCSFDRRGFVYDHGSKAGRMETTTLGIAYAVAASSAFPPLFPPIAIDNKVLMCDKNEFPNVEYLTDGGVYDNLGLTKLLSLQGIEEMDIIIASDAARNFDWTLDKRYISFISRNVRASDMLMKRVSDLQRHTPDHPNIHRVQISDNFSSDRDPNTPDVGTQRAMRNIRTDFDSFSAAEIDALVIHGYNITRQRCLAARV